MILQYVEGEQLQISKVHSFDSTGTRFSIWMNSVLLLDVNAQRIHMQLHRFFLLFLFPPTISYLIQARWTVNARCLNINHRKGNNLSNVWLKNYSEATILRFFLHRYMQPLHLHLHSVFSIRMHCHWSAMTKNISRFIELMIMTKRARARWAISLASDNDRSVTHHLCKRVAEPSCTLVAILLGFFDRLTIIVNIRERPSDTNTSILNYN